MSEQPLHRIENEAPPIDWSDVDAPAAMTALVSPPPNYAHIVAPAPAEQPLERVVSIFEKKNTQAASLPADGFPL